MKLFDDKPTALASAWTINSLAYSIVYPFLPIYLHEGRGVPMEQVGLIFPLMGMAVIAMPLVAGPLTDRIGRRSMMQFGQTSRAAMFLLLALMDFCEAPFQLFAVALMVNAGIGTFFQVGADAYLSDISRIEDRPRVYSKIRIGTNIGWALGPMLGAFLARTPFSLMFAMTAVLCLLGARYTGWCCPETAAAAPRGDSVKRIPGIGIRELVCDRGLLKVLGCSFLLFLLTSQLYSIMPVYGTGVVGVSKNALGFLFSLNGFVIIFCQMPITHLLDRMNLAPPARLVGGAMLYAVGYFSLGFALNAWMMAFSVAVLTLGEAVVNPSLYTQISRSAPAGGVGRYMAAYELVRGVGYAVGPYLGSVLFARLSPRPLLLWGVLAMLGVAAAAGFHLFSRTGNARVTDR